MITQISMPRDRLEPYDLTKIYWKEEQLTSVAIFCYNYIATLHPVWSTSSCVYLCYAVPGGGVYPR